MSSEGECAVNLLELIRQLAAATTDGERAALQTAIEVTLRAATPEGLQSALSDLRSAATELATHEDTEANVALLEAYATQHAAIQAELTSRGNAATLADRAALARATFDAGDGTEPARHDPADDQVQPGPGVPTPGDQGGGEGNQPGGANQPEGEGGGQHEAPEGENGGEGGQPGGQGAPRNLGGLNNQRGNDNTGGANTITMTTPVDGDVPGFTAGATLDRAAMARAFGAKARALNSAGAAGRHNVVHVEFNYPEAYTLGSNYDQNMDRLATARRPEALTAAVQSGGLCLPLQVLYDIATVGVTNRPVRGSLTPFRVER